MKILEKHLLLTIKIKVKSLEKCLVGLQYVP